MKSIENKNLEPKNAQNGKQASSIERPVLAHLSLSFFGGITALFD